MSLQSQLVYVVPTLTADVAHAAFPKGNLYMCLYDTLGVIFEDAQFAALFSHTGQPAASPVRVALATILQFAEGLSDRQAADAVRGRLDWKYLLCLELTDPGFDHTVLSEFRTRLLAGEAEALLFDTLLSRFQEHGYIKARGKQRTDSTHVLAAIRALNRLECVGETMRATLNALAVAAPPWLLAHTLPEWVDRYGPRVDDYRLPDTQAQRQAHAERIGADGVHLLKAIYDQTAPQWLRELPAVQTLRQVWVQNFTWLDGHFWWRDDANIPPAETYISSPYDCEAHYAKKRSTSWVGYKIHVTETCDDDLPRLLTNIETTTGPVADGAVVGCIHARLKERDLLPQTHIVDMGYVDAELLATSQQEYGVDLFGPARGDYHQQAHGGEGFSAEHFQIDWAAEEAICPAGCRSSSWSPTSDARGNDVIRIKFALADCGRCPLQPACTSASPPRRMISVRPQDQYQALQGARARQMTEEFKEQYGERAGVEGTLSQGVRRCGVRRARYLGQSKVGLEHLLIGTAMNVVRLGEWLAGKAPAQTRQSAFVRLHQLAA